MKGWRVGGLEREFNCKGGEERKEGVYWLESGVLVILGFAS